MNIVLQDWTYTGTPRQIVEQMRSFHFTPTKSIPAWIAQSVEAAHVAFNVRIVIPDDATVDDQCEAYVGGLLTYGLAQPLAKVGPPWDPDLVDEKKTLTNG